MRRRQDWEGTVMGLRRDWDGTETGPRQDRDGTKMGPRWDQDGTETALKYYFFWKFQLIQIANAKIFQKITWVKIFVNIYAPVLLIFLFFSLLWWKRIFAPRRVGTYATLSEMRDTSL